MKKIALFIPSMYPSGGAERVTHQLANDLSETHDVTVITLVENVFPDCLYTKKSLGFSHSKISKVWSMISGPKKLAQYCNEEDINLVISHMERANFISLLSKIPTVAVVHNYKYLHKLSNRFFISLLYPKAKKVVAVSQGVENKLKKLFSLENTKTIYNYFDLKKIESHLQEPLQNSDESLFTNKLFTFINIGRLTRQKGQNVLIRAFAKASLPNSQLLIVGEGEDRNTLEKLCEELGMSHSIHMIGTRENVFPLLQASDCFVLTSRWEGFGLVLVEALAAGLPVISTDCESGPQEILVSKSESLGELLRVDDTDELSSLLQKQVSRTPKPDKLKNRARDFSKESIVPTWLEILES